MTGTFKISNLTPAQRTKYLELEELYKKLHKEVEKLEIEGRALRRELKEIADKAKMKNILQDIIKQPD